MAAAEEMEREQRKAKTARVLLDVKDLSKLREINKSNLYHQKIVTLLGLSGLGLAIVLSELCLGRDDADERCTGAGIEIVKAMITGSTCVMLALMGRQILQVPLRTALCVHCAIFGPDAARCTVRKAQQSRCAIP